MGSKGKTDGREDGGGTCAIGDHAWRLSCVDLTCATRSGGAVGRERGWKGSKKVATVSKEVRG